jgi:hypothetical protein
VHSPIAVIRAENFTRSTFRQPPDGESSGGRGKEKASSVADPHRREKLMTRGNIQHLLTKAMPPTVSDSRDAISMGILKARQM